MNSRKAFTLVEILIVVMILAILAAIALPKFSSATTTARGSMLVDDVRILRTQLQVFRAQHQMAAGYPVDGGTPTEAILAAQMTLKSNFSGQTAALGTPGFKMGPYLREMPANPINGKTSVLVLADGDAMPAAASDVYGWIYKPSTLAVKADCKGQDESGKSYWDY